MAKSPAEPTATEESLIEQWKGTLELVAIIIGGLGALYLYFVNRRGEVTVAIVATPSIHIADESAAVLLLDLTISNDSNVLIVYDEAVVTLFDAKGRAAEGQMRLVPFAQADPFIPVYADVTDNVGLIAAGQVFSTLASQDVSLEPREGVRTAVSFPLRTNELGLMAARVFIRGREGRSIRFWRRWRDWNWSTFLYIDPDALASSEEGRTIEKEETDETNKRQDSGQ